jgi:ubiquinone/menaquinone biosynthesis C-methylase UbiE
MDIWKYVQKYDFSSPENQIKLLVEEAKKTASGKKLKILDIGGGFKNRKEMLGELGEITTLDVQVGVGVDIVGDAHKLPFPDKSFDLITLFMVLEHLENPEKALSEIARVLKPKGILLLTTVQYWHSHPCPKDYYRFTEDGLLYLCDKSSLKIKKIWSQGGPALVIFHAIELNLPEILRKFFLLLAPVFDKLDNRKLSDSVGWSLIAVK